MKLLIINLDNETTLWVDETTLHEGCPIENIVLPSEDEIGAARYTITSGPLRAIRKVEENYEEFMIIEVRKLRELAGRKY